MPDPISLPVSIPLSASKVRVVAPVPWGFFVCLLCLSLLVNTASATDQEFAILYTANLNGVLTDCACGEGPAGGLDRLSWLIDSLRAKMPHLLVLDGGDLLRSYSQPALNQFVVQWFLNKGYHAANVGDQELVEGPGFLSRFSARKPANWPWISLNLTSHSEEATQLWKPWKLLSVGGLAVAITGMVEEQAFSFLALPGSLEVRDWKTALSAWQNSFDSGGKNPFRILLWHGSWTSAEYIARHFPWLNLILLAHNQEQRARRIGNAWLLEPGTDAQYVLLLQVSRVSPGWKITHRFLPVGREIPPDSSITRSLPALIGQ